MKTKLLAMLLMAGSTMFAGVRFGVGIGVGVPIGPAPVIAAPVIPPCPGPGYVWTNGVWVAPYVGVGGYWGGRGYYGGHYYARPAYRGGYARGYRR